jgi:hypothetical protein
MTAYLLLVAFTPAGSYYKYNTGNMQSKLAEFCRDEARKK